MEVNNVAIAMGIAMGMALVTEGISWYFIYRTEDYK